MIILIRVSTSRKVFNLTNVIFLALLALSMFLPIMNVVAKSLSGVKALTMGDVSFLPVDFTLINYQYVFSNVSIIRAFGVTIYITVLGTFINLLMTSTLAYSLSRNEFIGKRFFLMMVLLTTIFSTPLIPLFVWISKLNLMNTLWVLMIPGAISAFNFFVMRSFFQQIPSELIDSARIDGCSEVRILWNIVAPLSKPVMATMGLFYGIGHWNTYAHALYFINDPRFYPLQVKLRQMLITDEVQADSGSMFQELIGTPEGIQMATIIVTMVPIIMVYPFLQRFFIKGMLIGSIKS